MASQINIINDEQIRKLLSESKNSLNPLSMKFTYEYVKNLVSLDWNDIYFAIENNYLEHQSAIEHAFVELMKNERITEEVLELTYMSKSEAKYPFDVCQLVEKIVTLHNINNIFNVAEKFLYVSLNWVYEHKDNYSNAVGVIDILCDNINYPDEVKKLISFMPTPDLTIEEPFEKLKLYLKKQQKYWNKLS